MLTADRILYVVSFSSLIQNMQVQYLQVLLLTYILHLCRLIFLRGRTEEPTNITLTSYLGTVPRKNIHPSTFCK